MLGRVAAVAVIRVDMGDLADLWPCLGGTDRGGDSISGLNISNAEDVLGIGVGDVEHEIGASVREDRQQAKLLGDRCKRRAVTARNDTGE